MMPAACAGWQIGDNQCDGLRMLVDDERQQILAVDLLQKTERQCFDLLTDIIQRVGSVFPQCFFDQSSRHFQATGTTAHAARRGVGEFVDNDFLLFAGGISHFGNFNRHRLNLLGIELGENFRRLVLGQAGEQHSGFAEIGQVGHVSCSHFGANRRARRHWFVAGDGRSCLIARRGFRANCPKAIAPLHRWIDFANPPRIQTIPKPA